MITKILSWWREKVKEYRDYRDRQEYRALATKGVIGYFVIWESAYEEWRKKKYNMCFTCKHSELVHEKKVQETRFPELLMEPCKKCECPAFTIAPVNMRCVWVPMLDERCADLFPGEEEDAH